MAIPEYINLEIVIPVYNEEHAIGNCIEKLSGFLFPNLPCDWKIIIVNNGSTDGTLAKIKLLKEKYEFVDYIHLEQAGRGRALRKAWMDSDADIVCYMDVDLSTDLLALPVMVDSLCNGYDIATGSRLMPESAIKRSLKREIISRCYNVFVKWMLHTHFSDAQCGFKGAQTKAIKDLLPLIKDQNWFFDTELLVLAEKRGYKIADIPVIWNEDPDSRVRIINAAIEDVKGVLRLRRALKK